MSTAPHKLCVIISHSSDHELSSVGFTIANGGITAGQQVCIFLTSGGVDLARKGAIDMTECKPLSPLAELVQDFLARGGTLWACAPCVKSRGYTQEQLIEGTIITGASVLHNALMEGASSLCF